jgi:hypothetical protein
MQPTRKEIEAKLTLPNLIAWLETQDSDTRYEYGRCCGCLLARFLKAQGYANVTLGSTTGNVDNVEFTIPELLDRIAHDSLKSYGHALNLARQFMPGA